MDELINQTELLKALIRAKGDEINNPVLVTSMLSELDFFIENVKEE